MRKMFVERKMIEVLLDDDTEAPEIPTPSYIKTVVAYYSNGSSERFNLCEYGYGKIHSYFNYSDVGVRTFVSLLCREVQGSSRPMSHRLGGVTRSGPVIGIDYSIHNATYDYGEVTIVDGYVITPWKKRSSM